MKKSLFLLTVMILALGICLASCGNGGETPDSGNNTHTHSFGEWITIKKVTCAEEGEMARYCDCGEKQTETLPPNGEHTEVIDEAVAPTCSKSGLTEGKHCSVCNTVIVEQTTIDPNGEHTEVIDEAVAPTCTQSGLTEGKHCSGCNIVIVEQTIIDPKGEHTEVVDPAVAPTCSSVGLTEGKHCSDCGTVFVKQSEIPSLPHTYGEWIVTKVANCGQDGELARYCSCGAKQTEVVHGEGMHGEVTDYAVAPTCSSTGLTEGKHCPYCNTIFVQQEIIPALEHVFNTTYSFDNSFHWYACSGCGIAKDKAEHQLSDDGMCTVCDNPIGATEGVIYEKSDDGTYAIVVAYNGSATKVRIADSYAGLPVKVIYSKAFYYKDTITSVIIPDSVTSIGDHAFYYCSLTSIVIPDSVTSIGDYAFSYCDRLTSVVIGDSVTSIGDHAFQYCYSLTSVVIGDSVTSIGNYAFDGCYNLTSVVIGDSVTSIGGYAFDGCNSLPLNEYENGIYLGKDDNPYFALLEITTKNLSSYTIHEDTKIIAGYVFSDCDRLTSITIPDSVTSIGSCAFCGCTSLTSISIPDSVASIGDNAFNNCSSLSSVVIGDSVTSIGSCAFYECDSLTSVVIPDSVTSIGDEAFNDCDSLSSVVIGDSVTSIGDGAFYECDSLTSVVIGNSVTSIGDFAFYGCNSLTSVVIGDSVTSIGNSAFQNCFSLTDVYYTGSEAEWNSITIGDSNYYFTSATKHYDYVPVN